MNHPSETRTTTRSNTPAYRLAAAVIAVLGALTVVGLEGASAPHDSPTTSRYVAPHTPGVSYTIAIPAPGTSPSAG